MEAQQTPGGGVVLGFPDFAVVVGHALQVGHEQKNLVDPTRQHSLNTNHLDYLQTDCLL
jgi:hypothetical protein